MGNSYSQSAESAESASARFFEEARRIQASMEANTFTQLKSASDIFNAEARLEAEARTLENIARKNLENSIRRHKSLKFTLLLFAGAATAALVVALAADFVTHEYTPYIRFLMKRKILALERPASLPRLPLSQHLTMLQVNVLPSRNFLPLLLLGKHGCGKSILLGDHVLDMLGKGVPTVYVRLQLPVCRPSSSSTSESLARAMATVDDLSNQICSQLHYPNRRAVIGDLLSRGFEVMGRHTQVDLTPCVSRAIDALNMTFDVCEEIKNERIKKGMTVIDAAPVVVFDEAQSLVEDVLLKNAGGVVIFAALGTLAASYGPGRYATRAVIAGSVAELHFLFNKLPAARGDRIRHVGIGDPTDEEMTRALTLRGYSRADSDAMIGLCGTRLRLFDEPLDVESDSITAASFLASSSSAASADFATVFSRLNVQETDALVHVLDTISANVNSCTPLACSVKSLKLLEKANTSHVLYMDRDRNYSFQTLLHCNTWSRVRQQYYSPPKATLQGFRLC